MDLLKKTARLLPAILIVLFASCQKDSNQKVTIHRFDQDLQRIEPNDSIGEVQFRQKYATVIRLYLPLISKANNDSITSGTSEWENFANSNAIKFFQKDVDTAFQSMEMTEKQLAKVKFNLKEKFGLPFPEIYAAIIPYNQSIIFSLEKDTIAIIGLNHYLGADYKPYEHFPEYIRRFKTKEKICYDFAEAFLKVACPYRPNQRTLLEKMLYEGIIAAAASQAISDFDERLYFSFTQEQADWCSQHERLIWNQLLIDDILFSTSDVVSDNLLHPAPSSSAVSQQAPGKTGAWIGFRIVEKLTDGDPSRIAEILKDESYKDSQELLINANYNGQ